MGFKILGIQDRTNGGENTLTARQARLVLLLRRGEAWSGRGILCQPWRDAGHQRADPAQERQGGVADDARLSRKCCARRARPATRPTWGWASQRSCRGS